MPIRRPLGLRVRLGVDLTQGERADFDLDVYRRARNLIERIAKEVEGNGEAGGPLAAEAVRLLAADGLVRGLSPAMVAAAVLAAVDHHGCCDLGKLGRAMLGFAPKMQPASLRSDPIEKTLTEAKTLEETEMRRLLEDSPATEAS